MDKRTILIIIGSILLLASAAGAFFIANNEQKSALQTTESMQSTEDSAAQDTSQPADSATKLSGTFASVGEKTGSGSVQIVTENGTSRVELGDDFAVQQGPDLYIGFGNDGVVDVATLITPLKATSGAQTYDLPKSINVADYKQIFIYCKEFSTVFSAADLT